MRVAHLARKPISEGSVGRNVLRHMTGGINVDASRTGSPSPSIDRRKSIVGKSIGGTGWVTPPRPPSYNEQKEGEKFGRWPANLVLIHKPECKLMGNRLIQGDLRDTGGPLGGTRPGGFIDVGSAKGSDRPVGRVYGTETIEAWECVEGCPVAALDEQSGVSKASGGPIRQSGSSWKCSNQQGTYDRITDSGGASRFFKQVQDEG